MAGRCSTCVHAGPAHQRLCSPPTHQARRQEDDLHDLLIPARRGRGLPQALLRRLAHPPIHLGQLRPAQQLQQRLQHQWRQQRVRVPQRKALQPRQRRRRRLRAVVAVVVVCGRRVGREAAPVQLERAQVRPGGGRQVRGQAQGQVVQSQVRHAAGQVGGRRRLEAGVGPGRAHEGGGGRLEVQVQAGVVGQSPLGGEQLKQRGRPPLRLAAGGTVVAACVRRDGHHEALAAGGVQHEDPGEGAASVQEGEAGGAVQRVRAHHAHQGVRRQVCAHRCRGGARRQSILLYLTQVGAWVLRRCAPHRSKADPRYPGASAATRDHICRCLGEARCFCQTARLVYANSL